MDRIRDNFHFEIYDSSCELVLSMISKRIRIKKENKGNEDGKKVKFKDILGADYEQLMCSIVNNRRHEKKNKYLIPANNTRAKDKKEKDYVHTISTYLGFESKHHLLWGSEEEISAYSAALFHTLITDALRIRKGDINDETQKVLCDYLPYAFSLYYEIICGQFKDFAAYDLLYDNFPYANKNVSEEMEYHSSKEKVS